ncbi:ABC transporter substrate-binding protein [Tardiphaga sp. 215_C5_N2_1]|uniref:ABC transporter substrate-binding protein n=1 Tax=Tardiphaga sp. 215_C5_N2_1 TaxID=3240774 RepID=UPI003F8A822C
MTLKIAVSRGTPGFRALRNLGRACLARLARSALFAISLFAFAGPTRAQLKEPTVRIAVMNDQTSVYSDDSGKGSVIAAQMAVDDFGGKVRGIPVEVLALDHQNKPDLGASLARKAIDVDHVAAFFDIANTGVSLAVQEIAKNNDRVVVHVTSASAELYGKACSPTGAQWLYDTYSLAKGLASSLTDETHKKWFLLTVDYAFGHSMREEMTHEVQRLNGSITGSVRHPLNTSDFGSFLLQAQATNPDVLALLNAGNDTIVSLKQASEFGVLSGHVTVALPIFAITQVHAIGAKLSQNVVFMQGYYHDYDEASRAFAARFSEKMKRPPSQYQAAVYSAVNHYLKGVAAANSTNGIAVMKKMKEIPVNDFMTKDAKLREDGRLMRDMLIVEGKTPAESKGEWDLLKVKSMIPAASIIRPIKEGGCAYVQGAQ